MYFFVKIPKKNKYNNNNTIHNTLHNTRILMEIKNGQIKWGSELPMKLYTSPFFTSPRMRYKSDSSGTTTTYSLIH